MPDNSLPLLPVSAAAGTSTPIADDEKAAAAAGPPPPRRGTKPLAARLLDDISLNHADLPVLACCAVSGLADSCAFNAGGVFVSMQTGNTIFLALGAAFLPAGQPHLWLKSLTSIACFWVGCFLFSKLRHVHPQRKLTLSASFLVQAVFILVAAALSQARIVPAFSLKSLPPATAALLPEHELDESDMRILIPLGLLAFQFGGQIVSSRQLGFNEVPTNVLTSVYCDLLSDPKLFAPLRENPKRNRRFVAVVMIVVGAIAGGWLQRSRAGMSTALWIAGAIKVVIAVAWTGWKSRETKV